VLDVSKAAAELGWWPMKNLENSIQEMIRGRHAE
jgi:nucleoside-diphosphate-sugar epimerase